MDTITGVSDALHRARSAMAKLLHGELQRQAEGRVPQCGTFFQQSGGEGPERGTPRKIQQPQTAFLAGRDDPGGVCGTLSCYASAYGLRSARPRNQPETRTNPLITIGSNFGGTPDPLDNNGQKMRFLFGPSLSAFGHIGLGGSLGFADPERGTGFAYLMSHWEAGVLPRERCTSLVDAIYKAD